MKKSLSLLCVVIFILSFLLNTPLSYGFDRIERYYLTHAEREIQYRDEISPEVELGNITRNSPAPASNIAPYIKWLDYMKNDYSNLKKTELASSYYDTYYGQFAFAYDQALAVIAFTVAGKYTEAKETLNALRGIKNTIDADPKNKIKMFGNCYSYDVYSSKIVPALDYNRHVGPNMWIVIAINYYTYKTKDKSFQKLAKGIIDWTWTNSYTALNSSKGFLRGGYDYAQNKIYWASTEHNISSYSAIKYFADIFYGKASATGSAYMKKAASLRKWIEEDMYIYDYGAGSYRFMRGLSDPDHALDVNTWAVLAFGRYADPGNKVVNLDLSFGLGWAISYCQTVNNNIYNLAGLPLEGLSFCDYTSYLNAGVIWSEGTEGMVVAIKETGLYIGNESFYHYQVESMGQKITTPTGTVIGIPYTTAPTSRSFTVVDPYYSNDNPSVAGTTWYIFGELGINPLRPYKI